MNIPDEAIEAAAEAMKPTVPNKDGVLWMFQHDDGQTQEVTLTDAARAAIEAALPAIREAIAQEIEAAQPAPPPAVGPWMIGVPYATRIIRGGTP